MTILLDVVYLVGLLAALPFLVLKSLRTGKYRSDWKARFGQGEDLFTAQRKNKKILLLHCVSIGELLSVQTLIGRLLAEDDNLLIAISTGTDTGTARALSLYPPTGEGLYGLRVQAVRFPLDFSFAVESFLDRVRPDVVALIELETWPNFLAIATSRRIPVVILNGRISEKSFPRYRQIRPLMQSMLQQVQWIGAQTHSIKNRFIAVGANPRAIEVIPTLKYDNAQMGAAVSGREDLALSIGLTQNHRLFVAGSTGPGEEEPLLDAYLAARESHPELRLAIVPRHPEVVKQVVAAVQSRNLTPILRTQRRTGSAPELQPTEIFIMDTMGELRKLYALAFAVFVGRSLVNLGGSDMIEVAAMAKPCCFGPYTSNFAEAVELLLAEHVAVQVNNTTDLTKTMRAWLDNPPAALQMGKGARQLIEKQRGSTEQYVTKLLELAGLRNKTNA